MLMYTSTDYIKKVRAGTIIREESNRILRIVKSVLDDKIVMEEAPEPWGDDGYMVTVLIPEAFSKEVENHIKLSLENYGWKVVFELNYDENAGEPVSTTIRLVAFMSQPANKKETPKYDNSVDNIIKYLSNNTL